LGKQPQKNLNSNRAGPSQKRAGDLLGQEHPVPLKTPQLNFGGQGPVATPTPKGREGRFFLPASRSGTRGSEKGEKRKAARLSDKGMGDV